MEFQRHPREYNRKPVNGVSSQCRKKGAVAVAVAVAGSVWTTLMRGYEM